jgi:hypothetical protein
LYNIAFQLYISLSLIFFLFHLGVQISKINRATKKEIIGHVKFHQGKLILAVTSETLA